MTVRPREPKTLCNVFLNSSEGFTIVLEPQQIWKAKSYSNGFYSVRRNNVELSLTKKNFDKTFKVVEK